MDKILLKELEEKLKKSKLEIEEELKSFAKENKEIRNDWKTKYPKFNEGVGSESDEGEADEEEEYMDLLPVEHSLELKLREINRSLEKIKDGSYGICEHCGKEISRERLEAYPEVKLCIKCEKENEK